jgi:hypothetical protein
MGFTSRAGSCAEGGAGCHSDTVSQDDDDAAIAAWDSAPPWCKWSVEKTPYMPWSILGKATRCREKNSTAARANIILNRLDADQLRSVELAVYPYLDTDGDSGKAMASLREVQDDEQKALRMLEKKPRQRDG